METDLTPYTPLPLIPARSVLVIAPHPDDEVFGCGGAIALHRAAGVGVAVVILTDGAAHGDPLIRRAESQAAARVLDCAEPVFWGMSDRGLHYSEELVQRLVAQINEQGADLVYAPSPLEVHPDHRQAMTTVVEAVKRADGAVQVAFYEIGTPLQANALLDISAVWDTKLRAMQCFASQQTYQDYADHIASLNRYRTYSLPPSVKRAEAFCLLSRQELASGNWMDRIAFTKVLSPLDAHGYENQPLVSVLIRSMDSDLLAEALDSIAVQNYAAIEVVVVAARANHRPLPARCGPFPLRLIQPAEPLQRSQAANRGLTEARGEFLTFLDDDDWLLPGHIAKLVRTLKDLPSVRAAYSGVCLVDMQGAPVGTVFDMPFDPVRLYAGNMLPIHAAMFSKELLRLGCKFDESLDLFEDWDFWLQVCRLTTMAHVQGVSACYRVHPSSGVHNADDVRQEATKAIYRKWAWSWTPQFAEKLMARNWAFPDLEQDLQNAQLKNAHLVAVVAGHDAKTAGLESALNRTQDDLEHNRRALSQALEHQEQLQNSLRELGASYANVVAQKAQEIQVRDQLLHERLELINALVKSTSWRITRPLRGLTNALRIGLLPRLLRLVRLLPRGLVILSNEGVQGITYRLKKRWSSVQEQRLDYRDWVCRHDTPDDKTLRKWQVAAEQWGHQPLLSIVMPVFNPPIHLLREAVASIQRQIYPHWEVCIADDASTDPEVWLCLQQLAQDDHRIKVMRRQKNGHIAAASNSALELASGEFVVLMDNDDLLPPDALYWVVKAIVERPTAQIIYSDEDKLDSDGNRFGPYFKPDWNHALFLGHNLISHLGVYRTELVRKLGGFRPEFNGSQDYDLALRCIEVVDAKDIIHIPRVLYHWRAIEGSTATGNDAKPYALIAAERALQEHLVRSGRGGTIETLPTWNFRYTPPACNSEESLTVVLIQPDRNPPKKEDSAWVLDTRYGVDEVLFCPDNGDDINAAMSSSKGSVIALIRAGLQPESPESLRLLVDFARMSDCGLAAGTVRDAHGHLLRGGLVLNATTVASTLLEGLPKTVAGYMGRGSLTQELNAVSLECVAMRREVLQQHPKGFDGPLGGSRLGAVVWCLGLRRNGLKVIWCPQASWHVGSITPVSNIDADYSYFWSTYGGTLRPWLERDSAYHPSLDATAADFSFPLARV